MATSREGGQLSASLLAGSEPIYEFVCELCSDEGKILEAHGYCEDCNDYLCGDCFRHHRKSRLTKGHNLVGKEHMPRQKPVSRKHDSEEDRIIDTCPNHSDELIKYYCGSHQELGCSACMTVNHRNCKYVDYIKDIAAGTVDSREFDDLDIGLDSFIGETKSAIRDAQSSISEAENDNVKRISAIRKHTEEIVSTVKRLEADAIKQSENLKEEDVKHLTVVSNSCSSALSFAERTKATLQGLREKEKNCQLFVAMKKAKDKICSLQNDRDSVNQGARVRRCDFHPNVELLQNKHLLGQLSTQIKQCKLNPVSMTAKHQSAINIESSTDTHNCYITGSVLLSDGKLVLTDFHNNKVKLVDVSSGKILSDLTEEYPWDLTKVNDESVAITLLTQRKIHVVKVADTLMLEREIPVDGKCRGIDYSDGKFAVSFDEPKKVQLIDLQGNVFQTLDFSARSEFKEPLFVKFSKDNQSIYISDWNTHSVTMLTLSGQVKAKYTASDDFWPHNIFIDEQGFVYVCNSNGNKIHVLSSDLRKANVILSKNDGLCCPLSVAVCDETNHMYATRHGNDVGVYQLS